MPLLRTVLVFASTGSRLRPSSSAEDNPLPGRRSNLPKKNFVAQVRGHKIY